MFLGNALAMGCGGPPPIPQGGTSLLSAVNAAQLAAFTSTNNPSALAVINAAQLAALTSTNNPSALAVTNAAQLAALTSTNNPSALAVTNAAQLAALTSGGASAAENAMFAAGWDTWLRADQGTQDGAGNPVSAPGDSVGLWLPAVGGHSVSAAGAARPLIGALSNGKPCLLWDGATTATTISAGAGWEAGTYHLVCATFVMYQQTTPAAQYRHLIEFATGYLAIFADAPNHHCYFYDGAFKDCAAQVTGLHACGWQFYNDGASNLALMYRDDVATNLGNLYSPKSFGGTTALGEAAAGYQIKMDLADICWKTYAVGTAVDRTLITTHRAWSAAYWGSP